MPAARKVRRESCAGFQINLSLAATLWRHMISRMNPNRFRRFLLALSAALLLEAAAFSQATAPTPIRLGEVARQLSVQEIANIEGLLPPGGKPWLLIGEGLGFMSAPVHSVEAYLPPETTTRELRRGVVIPLQRRIVTTPEAWSVVNSASRPRATTGRYAQVAVEGRTFDQIQGDQDSNRPFWVDGRFEDSELVSIVAFIRSSPVPASGQRPITAGPIITLTRQSDDSVAIMTRLGAHESQRVILRKQGQSWVIAQVSVISA
jgi:hypothetical protein